MKRFALALLLALAVPLSAGGPMVMRASWYGPWHDGKPMANRQTFDRWGFTCAHRTLPLGTRLHLVELRSNRWVDVVVTDRGPYVPGRDLDLSEMAARQLRMDARGVALVQVTILGDRP